MDRSLKRECGDNPSEASPPKAAKSDAHGSSGMPVMLSANYFKVNKQPEFILTQYRVDFFPEIDLTQRRKALMGQNKEKFGGRYIFDGASLYLTQNFPDMQFDTLFENINVNVQIRRTGTIESTDPTAFQLFNLIFREAMSCLKLQNVRRDYYDPGAKIEVPSGRLELWPGYITSIRAHSNDVLMNAEISHKFMRKETILQITQKCMVEDRQNWKENVRKSILGSTVLTEYTNKTYLIDDIDFMMSPLSTFRTAGSQADVSYFDYYKKRYGIEIRDKGQFMLTSKSRERDIRAGQPELIHLVPELCRATGMTDEMRQNFQLMKELATHTRMDPEKRVKALKRFNNRIQSNPDSIKVLNEWKMELDENLIEVPGRELPIETILFGNGNEVPPNHKGEWAIKGQMSMYQPVPVNRWLCFFPKSMQGDVDKFLVEMKKAHVSMNCDYKDPLMIGLENDSQNTYLQEIRSIVDRKPKMLLIILPTNRADRYSALKKACLVEYGIPAQVVVKRSINHKSVGSIATKIAIQMNAKLGGVPWMIKLPVKGLMTVGFDVSHHPRDRSRSIGAMVATMDIKKSGAFYSVTSSYKDGNEMNNCLAMHMEKAISIYKDTCGAMPDKIIFYRDGVGEGQIQYVLKQEVEPLIQKLKALYGGEEPKLAYIIVSKRTNTRLFKKSGSIQVNPKPGTVVDREITLPGRNDFFLVSQHVGQGTVSPTAYNIIFNTSELNKDKLEIITFKFSHLYYNWSGTTRIPNVCQYAKKLAFITSQSLQAPVHENLERQLYFL